jgi:hypothetical protein
MRSREKYKNLDRYLKKEKTKNKNVDFEFNIILA